MDKIYFIEHLNTVAWLFQILPYLIRRRGARKKRAVCYYIEATRLGRAWAYATYWIGKVNLGKLEFRMLDIRDDKGLLLRLRIHYQDLFEVQGDVIESQEFTQYLSKVDHNDTLRAYLEKSVALPTFALRGSAGYALFLIQVCFWKMKQEGGGNCILFLGRQPWISAIKRYGTKYGVKVVEVYPGVNLNQRLRSHISPFTLEHLRRIRSRLYNVRFILQRAVLRKPGRLPSGSPKIAVEYSGHFNLDDPAKYSDLFFWQQSNLLASDLLVMFGFKQDLLDTKKWQALKQYGIGAVALYPGASTVPTVPIFVPPFSPRLNRTWVRTVLARGQGQSLERQWLDYQRSEYETVRDFWQNVCKEYNVSLLVSWYRYNTRQLAISQALRDLGGISAIYQRSFQVDPSPEFTVDVDLMFGHSRFDAEVERQSRSQIRYFVVVGHLGVHRFPLFRECAESLRRKLQASGAQYIISYFDENSQDDPRFNPGHFLTRESYAFLCEKVFADPTLGVIFKPKYPPTLRSRLGPVCEILDHAIATGRCILLQEGALHSARTPAEAALASDLAIHGHLYAGSAGLEAALAGVPTLLLDREGWPASPLYRLGVGRVVFQDWETLWNAVQEHRQNSQALPGLGDWSPMISEFDPFCDGKGAQRMGTYLKWIIDGLKDGQDRDTVLATAAEQYIERWGSDKILRIS